MNTKRIILIFLVTIFFMYAYAHGADRAVLVHNTLSDIEAVKGKLKLKLVRIWGGENEEDENKFFETPMDVLVDKNGLVYICDTHKHCIKVFTQSGEYVRTIGQRGRGPGDLLLPSKIAVSPSGDLVVCELDGNRMQWFSPEGKSKRINQDLKTISWLGITTGNETAVYHKEDTFKTRKLVAIQDGNGKVLRHIGTYHDRAPDYMSAEGLVFTMDSGDNIYAANRLTPVIRKYSPSGRMILAVTYETPLKISPVEITLNTGGDEIDIKRADEYYEPVKVIKKGRSIRTVGGRTSRVLICPAIGTDANQNIVVLTRRRLMTEKEMIAARVGFGSNFVHRKFVNYHILDQIKDLNQLLVFNSEGKVIAQTLLPHFCDSFYSSGSRIFIVDGLYHQQILEYEMTIEEVKKKR